MKVLVTGASGFIGSRLCRRLRESGVSVETVSRISRDGSHADRTSSGWSVDWPRGLGAIDFSGYDAVLHLAIPKNCSLAAAEESSLHTSAVEGILRGVEETSPACTIVFLSSQSAVENALSGYGRGKWACEALLRASKLPHVIVRPGLVVSHSEASGLFGAITKAIAAFPLVPIPHDKGLVVQPVHVDDVVRCLEVIVRDLPNFSGKSVSLALPPRSLPDLLRDTCWESGRRRLIVPIPLFLSFAVLAVSKQLLPRLPLRRQNLDGLLLGRPIDPSEGGRILGSALSPFGLPRTNWTIEDRRSWEARFLSRAFFKREPTARMVQRYVIAHRNLPHLSTGPLSDVAAISKSGLIIEALEVATRSAASPLSGKLQVLGYLAEVDPLFGSVFVNPAPSRSTAWLSLAYRALLAAFLLAAGRLLRPSVLRRLRRELPCER